jgi:mRNA-degrading endonuclease RelE of RelBE toxin-antitoxin system
MITKPTRTFLRNLKELQKKYPSIIDDLVKFRIALLEDPQQGDSLGKSCYKVRFAISSKKTGKRNDSRIITCVRIQADTIHLLAAFEKGERATIKGKKLDNLLKEIIE